MSIKKGDAVIHKFVGDDPTENFEFPSIGIEDIDRAVFKLFNEKLNFQVSQKKETKKVPVVFAAGERFALTRRKNPIRDKNNAFILPLISIMRNDIAFGPDQDGKGTAISFREQPSYVIKRRLSKKDRDYQNAINKAGLLNQENVGTKRNSKNLTALSSAATLSPNLEKNIFEIIEIPYPEFVSLTYEVTFWTQYMNQANAMIETLIHNFDGQGEEIVMTTDTGYELVAFFDKSFNNNSNFDEFSDSERIIKNTITMKVPGYVLNPKHSGIPKLIKSYFSAPVINFNYQQVSRKIVQNIPENSQDKVLNNLIEDLIPDPNAEEESGPLIEEKIINPFTGEEVTQYSKILHRNSRQGETVASSLVVLDIETQSE